MILFLLGVLAEFSVFGSGLVPKMKTHKASRKRFKITATGKLKRVQAGKKHLNSPKTGKRKRQLRRPIMETGKVAQKYIKALGG
jgi:large subunit ribosomal protein L35